uniref:Uncharacterized protein n=1 Tax=viral metagenome TaxID=1070528 RepID=A0A6C0E3I2_9ZZZZ
MGAGQSIIEGENTQREGVLNISEIRELIGNTVFKWVDFSPNYYKAYSDPDKLQKMREAYQEFLKQNE